MIGRRLRLIPLGSLLAALMLSACASTGIQQDNRNAGSSMYSDDVFRISAMAETAYRESRWVDAARHYQQLTIQVPTDAYVWFKLANTYARQGEYDKAIHAYEQSIGRDSQQPKPWFNLSTAYLLNAKQALEQSWNSMRDTDPARAMISRRIEAIDTLLNQQLTTSGV